MSNLFDTFKEAIENATMKWEEYKQRENAYKGTVNQGLDKLQELIEKLKACIKKLVDLQDDYSSYIQRITQIRINMQTMLDQQITQITNRSGEDCDEKIRELLEKFQGFVTRIGEWEGDASRFEGLLAALKTEIDRLCDKADEIIAKNGENKSGLDEELRKVEEAMGQERGASKEESVNRETKRQETPQQQAQPENLPPGWEKATDEDSGRDYYICRATGVTQWEVPTEPCVAQTQVEQPRQQGEDFGEEFNCATHPKSRFGNDLREHIIGKMVEFGFRGIDRGGSQDINEAAGEKLARYVDKLLTQPRCASVLKNLGYARGSILANNLLREMTARVSKRSLIKGQDQRWRSADSSLRGGRRTRKKRGGWQTPEKLESISRYSPIRRVERKKKKKNTKKAKKNKRKRHKRKQTKRRGKKRN